MGMREVDVRVRGPGSGRESAIRAIQSSGLDIKAIDVCDHTVAIAEMTRLGVTFGSKVEADITAGGQ